MLKVQSIIDPQKANFSARSQAVKDEHVFLEILSKHSNLIEKRVYATCRKNYDGRILFDELLCDCQARLWEKFKSGYLTLESHDKEVNRLLTNAIADILRLTYGQSEEKRKINRATPFSVIDQEGNSYSATIKQKEENKPIELASKVSKLRIDTLALLKRDDVKLTPSQIDFLNAKIKAIDHLGDKATPSNINKWIQKELGITYIALQTRNSKITKAVKRAEIEAGELSVDRIYKSKNLKAQKIELFKDLKTLNSKLKPSDYVTNADKYLSACIAMGERERGSITTEIMQNTGLTEDQIKAMFSRHLNTLFEAYKLSKNSPVYKSKVA